RASWCRRSPAPRSGQPGERERSTASAAWWSSSWSATEPEAGQQDHVVPGTSREVRDVVAAFDPQVDDPGSHLTTDAAVDRELMSGSDVTPVAQGPRSGARGNKGAEGNSAGLGDLGQPQLAAQVIHQHVQLGSSFDRYAPAPGPAEGRGDGEHRVRHVG